MTSRAGEAAAAWEEWSHTRALLTVAGDLPAMSGPLTDLAVSVKDVYPVAGMPTRAGSLAVDARAASRDTPVVGALRRLGASIVAKSNCSEFGIGITVTDTRLGGRVVHPFDPAWLPGGSSGGDAVAVASGVVDLAVASDYGGSVRWPAQALGICGLRTTPQRLSRAGRVPPLSRLGDEAASLQDQLEAVSFLARRPGTLLRVLPLLGLGPTGDGSRLGSAGLRRVAVSSAAEIAPVDSDVTAALQSAMAAAESAGFGLVDPGPLFGGAAPAYAFLRGALDRMDALRELVRGREDLLCGATLSALDQAERARCAGPAELTEARSAATSIAAAVERMLEEVDAIVIPVAPVAGTTNPRGAQVGSTWVDQTGLMAFCRAVSLLGLPSFSLPVEVGANGRPVSVQILCRPGDDYHCCWLADILARTLALPGPELLPWSAGSTGRA